MALVCNNCKQIVTDKVDVTTGMPISVWVCENCGESNSASVPEAPIAQAPVVPSAFTPSPSSVTAPPIMPFEPPVSVTPVPEPPVPEAPVAPEIPLPPSPKTDSQI